MKIKAKGNGGATSALRHGEDQEPGFVLQDWTPRHESIHVKQILVPIDFSACSLKALQYAITLTKEFGGEMYLIHVVQPYFLSGDIPVDLAALQSNLQAEAKVQLDNLRRKIDGVCHASVRAGGAAHEIIAASKEVDADLIVIGTEGRTGLAHVLLGSVAERVVRLARCPVLVVREKEHDFINVEPPTIKSATPIRRSLIPKKRKKYEISI